MAKLTVEKRKKAPAEPEREGREPKPKEHVEPSDEKELDKTPAKKLYPNQK